MNSISVSIGNMVYDSRNNCNAIIETATNTLLHGCKNTTIPNGIQTIGSAFQGCKELKAINIPNTVTTIWPSAFAGCSGLTSIEIPNSVTSILGSAFESCSGLTSIKIPNSLTYISEGTFCGCKNLSSIDIPYGVTNIGEEAFYGCSNLESINIPNSVNSIGILAFAYCQSLSKIKIPNGIEEIKFNTFSGCTKLDTIIIPKSLTTLGYNPFGGCALNNVYCFAEDVPKAETSIVITPNYKTLHVPANSIEKYKKAKYWEYFGNIVALTDEELKMYDNDSASSVELEPDSAIEGIYQTQPNSYRIYNGNNVSYGKTCELFIIDNGDGTYYVDDLFGGWYSQRAGYGPAYSMSGNIKIDDDGKVSLVDSHVTGWGDSLTSLTGNYDAKTSTFTIEAEYVPGMKFYQTWVKDNCKVFMSNGIYYRTGENNTVSVVRGNYSGDIVIPDEVSHNGITYAVKFIEEKAFLGNKNLTSITLNNKINSISDDEFQNCTELTSVTLGDSVLSIGEWAFSDCTSLTTVNFGNSVFSIGEEAFAYCNKLTNLTLPDSLTTIGELAFSSNDLKTLTIPKYVLKIGAGAFTESEHLETINVDSENLKYDSRNNCNAIIETYTNRLILGCKNTVIPSNITAIGRYAFAGCNDLDNIHIPNSVLSIENGAFWNCKGLKTLIIGSNVETIGGWAFQDCTNLKTIIIPQSVKTIESSSFGYNPEIKDVYCYAEYVPKTSIDAFIETPIENVILHVPAASIDAYKAEEPWKNFKKIVAIDGKPEGDVNGDNVIDVADIGTIIDVMAAGDKVVERVIAADVNQDGVVDVADIAAIIDIMAGK